MNSTFANISLLPTENSRGGAMYVSIPSNYDVFSIDSCIFSKCSAAVGGVLYLMFTPFIYITKTRFEDNTATAGVDIYVMDYYECFYQPIASSTCSTSEDKDMRVNCTIISGNSFDPNELQNDCANDVVWTGLCIGWVFLC
jgi:hypothetical protein